MLQVNRGHWTIEISCPYILNCKYGEDRSRIRTGHGPENITRLRRFAIGMIKSRGAQSVPPKMRELTRHVRLVFDHLRVTRKRLRLTPHQSGVVTRQSSLLRPRLLAAALLLRRASRFLQSFERAAVWARLPKVKPILWPLLEQIYGGPEAAARDFTTR